MAMAWEDIVKTPDYQSATRKEQRQMANEYFNEVVAPEYSKKELPKIKGEFYRHVISLEKPQQPSPQQLSPQQPPQPPQQSQFERHMRSLGRGILGLTPLAQFIDPAETGLTIPEYQQQTKASKG